VSIDGSQDRDAVFFSQRLDLHALGIVDVAGNHSHSRRGAPGTVALHGSWSRCSKRNTVTRLLVLHAASSISLWSSADFITGLHRMIKSDSGKLELTVRGNYTRHRQN